MTKRHTARIKTNNMDWIALQLFLLPLDKHHSRSIRLAISDHKAQVTQVHAEKAYFHVRLG